MPQQKTMRTAAWLACLTIAAYVLAQATAAILSRSFDASSRSEATLAQGSSESVLPPLPRGNAAEGNKSAKVPKADAGSGIKIEQVSDTEWILDRESLLANTRNVNAFLNQARAVPYLKMGKTLGFRITRISLGSIYEKIGLQNGDVLLQVNSRKLNDLAKLDSLYAEMRNRRHISLVLSRDGKNQTFYYDIR